MTAPIFSISIVSVVVFVVMISLIVLYKRSNSARASNYLAGVFICVMWFIALASVLLDDYVDKCEVNQYVQASFDINRSTYPKSDCFCGCDSCTCANCQKTNIGST